MALFVLPTSEQFPWYTQQITLTNVAYTLEYRYNTRMQRWLLSIYSQAMVPLLLSIPLLIERNLLGQYGTYQVPPGALAVYDATGNGVEPTLSSFLTTHQILYLDAT